MKTLCVAIGILCLFAVGCDEKPSPRKAGNGWYEGPGYDGVGRYEGPAHLVPNKSTYLTNDRDLDNLQEAARCNGENAAALRNFNQNWEALDR